MSSFIQSSLAMAVSSVLLLIFIFISGVATHQDHKNPNCKWEGPMFFCGAPECPSGTKELGRSADAKSEIATFGEACMKGHRVLCCKDEVVGADPAEHCHFFNSIAGSQVCMWGKETIATESRTVNVVSKHYTMLCCDPEVLGAEKKETIEWE